jgi:quercetin dioxygenase-like cupin family protein
MTTTATLNTAELVLTAEEIAARPWRTLDHRPGVRDRTLWHDPATASFAGLLHLDPDGRIQPHAHPDAVHHLWVVAGEATIAGKAVPQGSYVFVPAGVEHGVEHAGRTGCLLFYLYLHAGGD